MLCSQRQVSGVEFGVAMPLGRRVVGLEKHHNLILSKFRSSLAPESGLLTVVRTHADSSVPVATQPERPRARQGLAFQAVRNKSCRYASCLSPRLTSLAPASASHSVSTASRRPSRSAPWARSPGRSRRPRSRSRATDVPSASRPTSCGAAPSASSSCTARRSASARRGRAGTGSSAR